MERTHTRTRACFPATLARLHFVLKPISQNLPTPGLQQGRRLQKTLTSLPQLCGRFEPGARMDHLQGLTRPNFPFESAAVGPETLEIAAASGIQDR